MTPLLCFRVNRKSYLNILEVLKSYEVLTNQHFNVYKYEISFPCRACKDLKKEAHNLFNIKEGNFPFKHLGSLIDPR